MHLLLMVWLAVCAIGCVLSARSIATLHATAPFTRIGWGFTIVYFVIAAVDALRTQAAPAHADYVAIALLSVAFVVAGLRDEPQAEPWWWPVRVGMTGRERRRS